MEIILTRNVLINGAHCAAGNTVTVDDRLGRNLIAMGKGKAARPAPAREKATSPKAEGRETR